MCLAQDHNAVTLVRLKPAPPRSQVKHSTTALDKKIFTLQVFAYLDLWFYTEKTQIIWVNIILYLISKPIYNIIYFLSRFYWNAILWNKHYIIFFCSFSDHRDRPYWLKLELLEFLESDVLPSQTEVKQGKFVDFISWTKGYFRETYKSQNINPISPTPKFKLGIIQIKVISLSTSFQPLVQ